MNRKDMKAVVVTTEFRGVFFGYIDPKHEGNRAKLKLHDARNCIYWAKETRGFLGLANTGPFGASRVGPSATTLLHKITSVSECTPKAIKQWETAPWA